MVLLRNDCKYKSTIEVLGINSDGNLEVFVNANSKAFYLEFQDSHEAVVFLQTIGMSTDEVKEIMGL